MNNHKSKHDQNMYDMFTFILTAAPVSSIQFIIADAFSAALLKKDKIIQMMMMMMMATITMLMSMMVTITLLMTMMVTITMLITLIIVNMMAMILFTTVTHSKTTRI